MEKLIIKNRKNQRVVVLIEVNESSKGLAFVAHGLSGFKEQPHIETYAEAFKEKGFTVVRFDTTNTFGESDGDYADATVTNYYEDLEDVIKWAKSQDWYREPFWLAGHSLGGITTALYAENYPDKVEAVAPTSTVVSGKLSFDLPKYKNWDEIKERGWIQEKRGVKLKVSHIEDRLKYDLLKNADKLTMPVLLIVGSLDESTPLKHQKLLYEKLPGKKELHVIEGSEHTFKQEDHLSQIKDIFLDWIDSKLSS
jgi:pimeloyl-ACP methyl ester carboxylesterase